MSLAVVTSAFTNDPKQWEVFRESTKRCGIVPHVLGEGKCYPQVDIFQKYAIPYLESISDEYVLLTDAYDVLCCRWDADEVIDMVDRAPGNLIVSCESSCWPAGPWGEAYGKPESPWWYCNGGQYVGTRAAILELWREFAANRWPETAGGSTQEALHQRFAAGVPMGRDTQCRIFQSMTGDTSKICHHKPTEEDAACPGRFTLYNNGIVWNTVTGYAPMFLHFSGRTEGLEDWYGKVWG